MTDPFTPLPPAAGSCAEHLSAWVSSHRCTDSLAVGLAVQGREWGASGPGSQEARLVLGACPSPAAGACPATGTSRGEGDGLAQQASRLRCSHL